MINAIVTGLAVVWLVYKWVIQNPIDQCSACNGFVEKFASQIRQTT